MKNLIIFLSILLLISCKKEELPLNTYTIKGHFLENCSTPRVNSKLRFRSIKPKITSIKVKVLAEVITDSNGYYEASYQDEKVFSKGQSEQMEIEFTVDGFPNTYIPLVDDVVMYKNLTLNYVTHPNDTVFFRTIGGANLSITDTLFLILDNNIFGIAVGPVNDNIPIDTVVYLYNPGRLQAVFWSVGRENIKIKRERNSNYGNYGGVPYERTYCSFTEVIIDLSNFKK